MGSSPCYGEGSYIISGGEGAPRLQARLAWLPVLLGLAPLQRCV